jgi:hypothetical protein
METRLLGKKAVEVRSWVLLA